jgi:CubicO group peptidase (beta-lactamase class C family)
MGRLVLVTLFALLIVTAEAPAKSKKKPKLTADPIVNGDLGSKIEAAVEKAGGPNFWGAVLVAKDGEILFAKGYGKADYRSTPNNPLTLFEIASSSKQITGAAIAHLIQKRKIKPTDSIARFFKGVPEDKKAVTVHHLVTHTSGISNRRGVAYASPIGRRAFVEFMLQPPLVSKPGEQYAYNNGAYALLAAVVEKASGKSFKEYCERYLFKPAGMTDTGFIGDKDLIRTGRSSTRRTQEPGAWTAANWHWGFGYKGMGGVVTTVHDLFKWDQVLRGDEVLDEKAKEILFTPEKGGYAYGWRVETTPRGTRKAHHSGNVAGYRANLVRFIEEDASFSVLTNDQNDPFAITSAIEPLLFEPVRLSVTINVKPYRKSQLPILKLPGDKVSWKATGRKKSFTLKLRQGKHTAFELQAPTSFGKMLIDSLTQSISAREADDAGGEAATEATLYLQPYQGLFPKFTLTEKLSMEIKPEYRHSKGVDKRVHIVVMDGQYRQWPMMALLNVAAARELLGVLTEALE